MGGEPRRSRPRGRRTRASPSRRGFRTRIRGTRRCSKEPSPSSRRAAIASISRPPWSTCGTALMATAPERALPMLTRAIDLAVDTRQHVVESWARNVVFWLHMSASDVEASTRAADALVASAQANGEPEGLAFGRTSQGRLSVLQGDLSTAREHFAEAVALSREKSSFWARADALICLCSVTMAVGDVGASRQILEEALRYFVPLRLAGTTVLFGALAKLLVDAGRAGSCPPGPVSGTGDLRQRRLAELDASGSHGQPHARDPGGPLHPRHVIGDAPTARSPTLAPR